MKYKQKIREALKGIMGALLLVSIMIVALSLEKMMY